MAVVRSYFLLSGRVQGVGFRYFTQMTAHGFNLLGWVRNLCDSQVEGVVEGDETMVKAFFAKIKKGPPIAVVNEFFEKNISSDKEFDDCFKSFEIRMDGASTWLNYSK